MNEAKAALHTAERHTVKLTARLRQLVIAMRMVSRKAWNTPTEHTQPLLEVDKRLMHNADRRMQQAADLLRDIDIGAA